MKIATRDLLAELLLTALDDAPTATVVRCLAAYGQANETVPPVVTPQVAVVDDLLRSVSVTDLNAMKQRLKQSPLLSYEEDGAVDRVRLAPAFAPEWNAIRHQLAHYAAALDNWSESDTSELTAAIHKSVVLFNQHLFFEVHEVLEPQWLLACGEVKQFLQGFIQIAVAFYHLGRRNLDGARALLHEGLCKILPQSPAFLGIALPAFITGLEACLEQLRSLSPATLEQFHTAQIPILALSEPAE